MKFRRTFLLGVTTLALLLAGCAYSIHPLYKVGETVFDPGLVGTWVWQDDGGERQEMTLREAKHSYYEASITDAESGRTFIYDVFLVRLGKQLYADALLEEELKGKVAVDSALGSVDLHMFLKLSIEGDALWVSALNQNWLEKQFEAKNISIAHEDLDQYTIIFTAAPRQLQEFLAQISSSPEAFDEPTQAHRKK